MPFSKPIASLWGLARAMKSYKSKMVPEAILDRSTARTMGVINVDDKLLIPAGEMRMSLVDGNLPVFTLILGKTGLYATMSIDNIEEMITSITNIKTRMMDGVSADAAAALQKASGK